MGISRGEAFETLELPFGADKDSIRTSYKRLAMKWHPDKHKNSPESIKNFLEISMAYKRLNIDSDIVQMSVGDCLELFRHTFDPPKLGFSNGLEISDEEDTEDDEDYDDDDDYEYAFPAKFGTSSGLQTFKEAIVKKTSPEEVEKNSNDLITEEEKEKRKAEKRRAKKKRRREKKRQEKVAEQKKEEDNKKKNSKKENGTQSKTKKKGSNSSGSEAEDFDRSAAFFTQVINKKKKGTVTEQSASSKSKPEPARTTNGNEDSLEDLDPVVLRSRQLAIEGNKMANVGHYQAAIDLFTEAVRLDPRDFRFFGNRSYCFDRMQQYEKALKDANKAISLAPDWPKGYFRKGRSLAGLKRFPDAEQAFMQVLKLDKNCDDAMSELMRVRTHQLTEMGFSQQQAQNAIRQYDSVQQALDSLLAGVVAETSLASEVYMSDEEEYSGAPSPKAHHPPSNSTQHHSTQHHSSVNSSTTNQKSNDVKMDHSNPEGLTALWVGNVLPEVTEKKLHTMFSKYGQVTSVRPLPEKYCAFINFKTKEAAGAAMKNLQSVSCAGQQLLIKFPDNPIVNGNTAGNVVIRKNPAPAPKSSASSNSSGSSQPQQPHQQQQAVGGGPKMSGPVNGDECYFWRTTGCHYGKDCHYRHVSDHKGLDKKPWQKNEKL